MQKTGRIASLALWPALLSGCVTTPYTGRSQLMIVSEQQEVGLGAQAYNQTVRESVLSDNAEALRIVRKVGERIARAADKPDYKWEFRVFDDPEQVNAFCLPGGKVGIYTGIFPVARDEAGLAVIVGHEVAHALLRHAGERISRVQLVGAGLGIVGAAGMNPALLQALGLGANVGLILPFSRSQESEADKVGLILMAKAGYDPRGAVDLWRRMDEVQKKQGAPPEFLSTHPTSSTRVEELRAYMPDALKYYQPVERQLEKLPSPQDLDSPRAKIERDLVKRINAVDQLAQQKERAVAEAIGANLKMDLYAVAQERQQLQTSYGLYAALRGLSYLGRAPLRQVIADYQSGARWSDLAQKNGVRLPELISWVSEVQRAATERR